MGVTGDDIQAEITDVTFPVHIHTNELYVIDTKDNNISQNRLGCETLFKWSRLVGSKAR